jgi:tRNA/tmRNA/rRNA uracil-C5-methylase (TrmA/RlmC/RlmD family)
MFSTSRLQEIHELAESRRRERVKGLTRNLEVCDLLDMRNVQSVAEHAPKITQFLLEEELRFMLPRNFMQEQKEVTEKMRAYLVDWLAELHFRFKLWSETLYVTVGIIDRFLAIDTSLKKSEL